MKIFLFLFCVVAAGILGYSFEPQMRYELTGKIPEQKRDPARTVVVNIGKPKKAIDPSTWPADKLPKKVKLKGDAEIANETGDMKMTVTAGNRVDLVRLEGQNVIISSGSGPFQGSVPIISTDLLDQLAVLAKNPAATNPDPADPPAIAANTPQVPVTVDPLDPSATLPGEGDVAVEAAIPEVASNDPEEPTPIEPVVEPESTAPGGSGDVVAVMRASIKGGDIEEFTFDQVLDWKANDEPETIDGESFQTGVVSYKAETVFGVKTIQAKALVKDGKVVRWLWPKSGMEIK